MWRLFEREATRRLVRHDFDHAYFSQIWPNNFQNFDGTIRPSILRSYGRPITVPIENVIHLTMKKNTAPTGTFPRLACHPSSTVSFSNVHPRAANRT